MRKVFGIGWARTGTTTLGECFRELGFDHQSQDLTLVRDIAAGDMSKALAIVEEKESFEDWPWIILYKELDDAFPGSRFVLTTRDSKRWIRSYENMLASKNTVNDELNEIRRILYGLPFPNVSREQLIHRYEKHNTDVLHYFANRPEALLVVDWEKGDGWKELCAFLRMDVPDKPFPHKNRTRYLQNYMLRLASSIIKKLPIM